MNDDAELLRRFADERSQEAFAGLVCGKLNLVYAAALRQTGGDAHLAEDVTQGVFIALAGRAAALKRHTVLTAWLYTTTRFLAIRAMRRQRRWQRREHEASAMTMKSAETPPAWEQLRPVIDEAMHELDTRDREALLLRFFEGRTFGEVGLAIGLAENSARMRVERALEKLKVRLAGRGVTSTAAALGVVLANQPVVAASAGLAALIVRSPEVSAGPRASGTTVRKHVMFRLPMMLAVTAAVATVGLVTYLVAKRSDGGADFGKLETGVRREVVPSDISSREAVAGGDPAKPSEGTVGPAVAGDDPRGKILANLRLIALARLMFIRREGRPPSSLSELAGPQKFMWAPPVIDGETYDGLDLIQGGRLSVTTQSGLMVTHDAAASGVGTPIPRGESAKQAAAGLEAKVFKALSVWRSERKMGDGPMPRSAQELLPYFETASDGADYVEWLEKIGWPQR